MFKINKILKIGAILLVIGLGVSIFTANQVAVSKIYNPVTLDAGLTDIAGLTPTDSNFIVGDGSNWVSEATSTARTSLGLGTISTLNTPLAYNYGGTGLSATGTAGYVLTASGTAPFMEWKEIPPTVPGGATTNIQFNNAGAFGGSANLTWSSDKMRVGFFDSSSRDSDVEIHGINRIFSNYEAQFGVFSNSESAINLGGKIMLGGRMDTSAVTKVPFAIISGRKENDTNNNTAGYLQFVVSTTGYVRNERMRITSLGNVGIGDTTPASMLTVGNGDLFQVNSSGVIVAAAGITSSGAINFSGLTTISQTASSTIAIGSDTRTSCISMGDSDGSGITYVTVNDGTLSATSTKPSICQ